MLTKKEIEVLRALQSSEAVDYSRGFYYNEFFESISVNYTCEQCDREMFDLMSLRKHIVEVHGGTVYKKFVPVTSRHHAPTASVHH